MEACSNLDGHRDPNPPEPALQGQTANPTTDHGLGDSSSAGGCRIGTEAQPGVLGPVVRMGKQSGKTDHAPQRKAQLENGFQVKDLVDLLNSTELGRVINDRQTRRHRDRAGRRFETGPENKYARIDLLGYIGWLVDERCLRLPAQIPVGRITRDGILRVIDRQAYRCALSGRLLTPDDAALDHIMPVSRGGEHLMENVQVLQKAVNCAKANMTDDEFIAMCRQVTKWTENRKIKEPEVE